MIGSDVNFRWALSLLLFCCTLLPGCAAMKDASAKIKTGMHIDAVLECAIEYPLPWIKDRRISYGGKSGEIRWKPRAQDGTVLKLKSDTAGQAPILPEQLVSSLRQEYTGLEITLTERVSLPAGEATHILAVTADKQVEIYQISGEKRSYLISLTMLKKNDKLYSGVMHKVIYTFQTL